MVLGFEREKKPLSETHPELAIQAVGWDPSTVSKGSARKYLWLCNKGHEYLAMPYNRIKGSGCPYCSGRAPLAGFNDMATTHPEFAAEADGWDPKHFVAGTGKKLSWKCAKGHQWTVSGNSRVAQNSGCPVCSNQKTISGINDLLTLNPEVAAEADGWDPTVINSGSNKKMSWKCASGHKWSVAVSNRTGTDGSGCAVCSGRKILSGFNDLASLHPELAAEADGWDPRNQLRAANKKMSWKCASGHMWEATVNSRLQGSDCPFCAGQRVIPGFNDLATINPELAAEADGWDPTTVTAGSNRNISWVCSNGHKWLAHIASRSDGTGCPYCSGKKVLVGFNDLATINPELAAEADGWDPTTVTAGSNRNISWVCSNGHKWLAHIASRSDGTGCPYCSGKKVLVGFNDLATINPELAAEADGWDPTTVTAGSGLKKQWKCINGHTWSAVIGSREKRGCPTCATSGFDPNKDAWLYFLRHDLWGLFQIGITNVPDTRVTLHKSFGWEVIEIRGPMPGGITRQWEHDILRSLQSRGVKFSPEQIAGKFSGYTEAWIQEDFPTKSLAELMNLVHKDEIIQ